MAPVAARGQSTTMLMLWLEMCGYWELWPVTPVERRGAMAAHITAKFLRLNANAGTNGVTAPPPGDMPPPCHRRGGDH